MSEFSEVLKKYVEDSGFTVSRIAQMCGVDRTLIQKFISGSRTPSQQALEAIAGSISINQRELKELSRMLEEERVGKDVIASRQAIRSLILDIRKIRDSEKVYSGEYIYEAKDAYQMIEDTMDLQKILIGMAMKEVQEEENPEVYLDYFSNCRYVLNTLKDLDETEKDVVCHQMLGLFKDKEGSLLNIQKLQTAIPFSFGFRHTYDVRFAYQASAEERSYTSLWPHYVVTSTQVLLISADEDRGMLISDRAAAEEYKKEILKLMEEYQPLMDAKGDLTVESVNYMANVPYSENRISLESFPCIIQLMGDDVLRGAMQKTPFEPHIDEYIKIISNVRDNKKSTFLYGMKGVKKFLETGKMPGFYGQFMNVEDPAVRRMMIESVRKWFAKNVDHVHILDESRFAIDDGISFELYGGKQLMIASTSDSYPYQYMIIHEPNICRAFEDYLYSLKDSEDVYPVEKTLEQYDIGSGPEIKQEFFSGAYAVISVVVNYHSAKD